MHFTGKINQLFKGTILKSFYSLFFLPFHEPVLHLYSVPDIPAAAGSFLSSFACFLFHILVPVHFLSIPVLAIHCDALCLCLGAGTPLYAAVAVHSPGMTDEVGVDRRGSTYSRRSFLGLKIGT